MSLSDTLDIPDYDCDGFDPDLYGEALHEGHDRAIRSTALASCDEDRHTLHPEEVRRRTLRGPQLESLKGFVAAEADLQTPGGLAIQVCLGSADVAYAGRPGKGNAEWSFLLTAPAVLWLRRRRQAVRDALGGSGEGRRLVERLFE